MRDHSEEKSAGLLAAELGLFGAEAHTDYLELRREEKAVEAACRLFHADPSAQAWKELRDTFAPFARLLGSHFQYEEREDFVQPVLNRRPSVMEDLKKLQQEHQAMIELARQLRGDFQAPAPIRAGQAEIRSRLETLLRLWEEHEEAENCLLMDVFWSDAGTVD